MWEARERSIWTPASWLMSLLANINRDPKQRARPFEPWEFNPYEREEQERRQRERLPSIGESEAIFKAALGVKE